MKRKRVLVIEDDVAQAEAIKEALETPENIIDVAFNGTEGLEKARRFRPDILVCDIGLPDIDGDEVARRMRADPELRSVRLVALSARSPAEEGERSRRAGFDDYVVKPPSFDALQKLLAEG